VRLTVARYQPDSFDGAALSPFVCLDGVRLGVVRTVSVVASTTNADVVVEGDDVLGNAVQVRVEEADPKIGDPDLRWRQVRDPIRLVRSSNSWKGAVALPVTSRPLRLVVEELEPGFQEVDGIETRVENAVFVEAVEL
jgi:hypothetical protein